MRGEARSASEFLGSSLPATGCELVLVRHGQSTANAQGIGQGRSEWPLSDLGRMQARATAERLGALEAVAAVYTSPLARAADTAAPIASALGLTPIVMDALVEIDSGAHAGRTWPQLEALHPAETAAYLAAEAARPHPCNRELLPGWEPVEATLVRIWGAIGAIVARHPGQRVVVVAHGGVLNAFLTHLLTGDARHTPWDHHLGNCAVTHVRLAEEGPEIVCLGDTAHLERLLAASGTPL